MKLYLKQKVFSIGGRFDIYDENGETKYYAEGEVFSIGRKLHIYNLDGKEVAFIHQKVMSFLPRFYVYVDGVQAAEIIREFSFFKPVYSIAGPEWEIEGDIWQHDYEITCNRRKIVSIYKKWFTIADAYEIDIDDESNEVMVLAVVLAIDFVLDAAAAANNNNN